MDDYLTSASAPLCAILLSVFTVFAALVSASEMVLFAPEAQNSREPSPWHTPERVLTVAVLLNVALCAAVSVLLSGLVRHVFAFGLPLQTLSCVAFLLIFVEWIPKHFALRHAAPVVRIMSPFYAAAFKFSGPVFRRMDGLFARIRKDVINHAYANLSVDELSQVIESTGEADSDEKNILEGVVRFGNNNVADVMTSRQDIVFVPLSMPFGQLVARIVESGFSRIPVCGESLDDVRGILYVKDLLPHLQGDDRFEWQRLLRKAFFVPETKKIDDLLAEFQKNKTHMAVVVDEFGITSGIVTLEDVVEEIVGEIRDEYDDDSELNHQQIDEKTYIFEAKILLNDFFKITRIDEDEFAGVTADVDSLGGLLIEMKGEMPREAEKLVYKNYTFEILKADKRKIKRVKLCVQ